MKIIPAIDIIEGKCVRLTKGDYAEKKIYSEHPLEVAYRFEGAGLQYLHLVDLDGAKEQHIVNWKVLEKIAAKTSLKIDFGGGVKSDNDIRIAFESGASQVTGGSIAAKDKETFKRWIAEYGSEQIILGADVKDEKICVAGWQEDTGINLFDFVTDYQQHGIKYVICTDISKDGMLEGSSLELYKKIKKKFPKIKLIASGGVSSIGELEKLTEMGIYGAIIGKAIYEGRIKLNEIANLFSKEVG